MPILTYFVVAGGALLGLLFYASASMEPRGPMAVTSNFEGLPPPWHGPAVVQNLAAQSAPEPDMNSEAVKAATPAATKTAEATTTGQAAKAEIAPRKKKHIARRIAPQGPRDTQHYAWQSGNQSPFGFFGRF